MATATAKNGQFVSIPRKEYEEFSDWKRKTGKVEEYVMTASEKRDLVKARIDFKKGNYITLDELTKELAGNHQRKGKRRN